MDGAEIYGKVLKVNMAKSNKHTIPHGKSLWSAEEWIQDHLTDELQEVNNNNSIDNQNN